MPHQGLEPASVLRLAFQPDALPAELSLPLVDRKQKSFNYSYGLQSFINHTYLLHLL